MFYGEYKHTIDRKGRLIIPAKFRLLTKENYIDKLYVTRGLDKCLFVFVEEEWKAQEHKFRSLPFTKRDSRKFNRLYFSGACEASLDKQGRILIPKYLKEYAQIKKEVIIVGVSNRFEIWDEGVWKEYYKNTQSSFEDIAEELIDPPDKF
ncbi:MAG: division/cell wall cluster transcriptional repressor MraZ [Candidatus Omnitrophica bacterium]|nr:division/cell wall cluster transcriptional repressor MraZ [Candidatus Omnitrophota bacterium]